MHAQALSHPLPLCCTIAHTAPIFRNFENTSPHAYAFLVHTRKFTFQSLLCHTSQGFAPPFDRHDWIVDRCGEEVGLIWSLAMKVVLVALASDSAPPKHFKLSNKPVSFTTHCSTSSFISFQLTINPTVLLLGVLQWVYIWPSYCSKEHEMKFKWNWTHYFVVKKLIISCRSGGYNLAKKRACCCSPILCWFTCKCP